MSEQCHHEWENGQRITPHAWIIRCMKCGATTISTDGKD